jgi:hypothetical protein
MVSGRTYHDSPLYMREFMRMLAAASDTVGGENGPEIKTSGTASTGGAQDGDFGHAPG